MKRLNPDIVHLHSHLNIQALQIVKAARAMGSSTVVTVHGVSAKISPFVDFAQRTYLKTIGKQLFTLADGIICLTGSDAQELIQIGVQSNKIHVISNGVNEDFFNYCAEDDGQTVVWHGRFVPQKGLHYFVKTARMIKGSLPNVRFRMLGSGPQFDEIQRMVESAGLKDRFEFLGKIPWDEVPRAISSASLYMLPSLREGMPWSILEAMSCGKPVVAFSIPGVVDLVEVDGTGYLTDSGDVKMLAKHAIHLLENTSLRGSFGLRARRIVEEKYTWAKIAARTIKLYRRVS
jgi:colanic acid/amylovoran biosynthesis glycosyltransferase